MPVGWLTSAFHPKQTFASIKQRHMLASGKERAVGAKRIASIGLLLALSALGLANIVSAVLYGGVWMTRTGFNWTYFESDPVLFLWSLVLSIVAFVGLGGLAIFCICSVRAEKKFLNELSSKPRFEDGAKTSRQDDT